MITCWYLRELIFLGVHIEKGDLAAPLCHVFFLGRWGSFGAVLKSKRHCWLSYLLFSLNRDEPLHPFAVLNFTGIDIAF